MQISIGKFIHVVYLICNFQRKSFYSCVLKLMHASFHSFFLVRLLLNEAETSGRRKIVGYTNTGAMAAPTILCSLFNCWWECVLSKEKKNIYIYITNAFGLASKIRVFHHDLLLHRSDAAIVTETKVAVEKMTQAELTFACHCQPLRKLLRVVELRCG